MSPYDDSSFPDLLPLGLVVRPYGGIKAEPPDVRAEKRQRGRGVSLWLVGLDPEVLVMVQRSPLGKVLGREAMHFNLDVAIAKYLALPATPSLE